MPIYSVNKKARFDYEILETIEAGLVLLGHEVKSVRAGNMNLKNAFVTFHGDDAVLTNAHIGKYKFAGNITHYEPERSRKLLLTRKQIEYVRGKSLEAGLTIVPLSVYTKGPNIKIEIAVAKGKKKYDKREATKRRETEREIKRKIKEQF